LSVRKTTGAFNDCIRVLDQMLQRNGGVAHFPDERSAVIFRHRCYKLRKMLFLASEKSSPPGSIPSTPYDDIFIKKAPGSSDLEFCLRSQEAIPDLEFKDEAPKLDLGDLDLE